METFFNLQSYSYLYPYRGTCPKYSGSFRAPTSSRIQVRLYDLINF